MTDLPGWGCQNIFLKTRRKPAGSRPCNLYPHPSSLHLPMPLTASRRIAAKSFLKLRMLCRYALTVAALYTVYTC